MQGQSDSKVTNKTEFMRYVDENPAALPEFAGLLRHYKPVPTCAPAFGSWIRSNHLPVFCAAYKSYWLNHPELYESQPAVLSV